MLVQHLARILRERHGWDAGDDPRALARLKEAAEGAKRRLSANDSTRIGLVGLPGRAGRVQDFELLLTRDEAETLWQPVLERMRAPVLRALRDASARSESIDEILLVGGSTRMPCVVRFFAEIFGRLPERKLPPDDAVAMGASVQAALKARDSTVADMVVTDVAPFTLGTDSSHESMGHQISGVFCPIIERGTVIPAAVSSGS